MSESSDEYVAFLNALHLLQDAAQALADVEVAEIRFKASKQPMHTFQRKLLMETPAIHRPLHEPSNPNELIQLEGILLTRTPWTK